MSEEELEDDDDEISELANSKRGRGLKVQISVDQFEEFTNQLIFVQRNLSDSSLEFSSEPWGEQEGFESGPFNSKYYIANPSRNFENLYITEVEMDWQSMEYVAEQDAFSWKNNFRRVAFYRLGGWTGVREYS